MTESYQEKVELKYIDTKRTGFKDYPAIKRLIQMGYPFPIITIDGQPKFAGKIDVDQIRKTVDELI